LPCSIPLFRTHCIPLHYENTTKLKDQKQEKIYL
jgi:hypothetical protein